MVQERDSTNAVLNSVSSFSGKILTGVHIGG